MRYSRVSPAQDSLYITFFSPSTLHREAERRSDLPIIGNGPPATFVHFPDGLRVSLPTDQIVFASDETGCARVAFGGMRFVGARDGTLTFVRAREVLPADQLSPARSHVMHLAESWVDSVEHGGVTIWPVR